MKKKNLVIYQLLFIFLNLWLNSCKKDDNTPTVRDIDGNIYNIITIGDQVWMKESLRCTRFQDGSSIHKSLTLNNDWGIQPSPAYCINGDSKVYGFLYNGYVVTDTKNVCPDNWHVPTLDEWKTLIDTLGVAALAGGNLKEITTKYWESPNTGATNSSEFTAEPSGTIDMSGVFHHIGEYSEFWTSTSDDVNSIWYNGVIYDDTYVFTETTTSKHTGIPIRCIKNK